VIPGNSKGNSSLGDDWAAVASASTPHNRGSRFAMLATDDDGDSTDGHSLRGSLSLIADAQSRERDTVHHRHRRRPCSNHLSCHDYNNNNNNTLLPAVVLRSTVKLPVAEGPTSQQRK